MLPAGHYLLGPQTGTLQVRTSREGAYASAGHDLVIEVASWDATLDVGDDFATLELAADSHSLHPRWGFNGLNSLTDSDRDNIRRTIDAKVLRGMGIRFSGRAALAPGRPVIVTGSLTIGMATRQLTFELRPSPGGRVDATARLTQSDFSIKPYSALLGALKVRDTLEIVARAQLTAPVAAVHAAA